MRSLLVGVALVAAAGIPSILGNAAAQSARPYAGMQARAIKALSPEQIADLKAGRGMGLALAAELMAILGRVMCWSLATSLGSRISSAQMSSGYSTP